DLHTLRALSGPEIASAIGRAFEQNAGDAATGLRDRLERFESMFPAVEAGDTLVLTYLPGRGTSVVAKGKEVGVVEGKDFADVVLGLDRREAGRSGGQAGLARRRTVSRQG